MPKTNVIYDGNLDDTSITKEVFQRTGATLEKREGGVDGERRFTLDLNDDIEENRTHIAETLTTLGMRQDLFVGEKVFMQHAGEIAQNAVRFSHGDDME